MQCPACHYSHAAPVKFCAQCGSPMPPGQSPSQPRNRLKTLTRAGIILGILLLVGGLAVGGYAWMKAEKARDVAMTYIGHLARGDKQAACAMYTWADADSCTRLMESWQKQFGGAHSFAIESVTWSGWTGFFTLGFDVEIAYTKGAGQGLMELVVFPDKQRPAWNPIEAF